MITDPDKAGESVVPGKTVFEGKEYDHVFSIDIDDDKVIKLPYNNDQVAKSSASFFDASISYAISFPFNNVWIF
jgi:hypothetical protein